jgi:D-tyrosyl-tRNA(Tyr) deacylase
MVDGDIIAAIPRGLLVLACAMEGDEARDVEWLASRLTSLRVFPDEHGKMNRDVRDHHAAHAGVGGAGVLVVSQFTLAADLSPGRSRGNRPSFGRAAAPSLACPQLEEFVDRLRAGLPSIPVRTGRFGADMQVELVNDGPVTLWLDSSQPAGPTGGTVLP